MARPSRQLTLWRWLCSTLLVLMLSSIAAKSIAAPAFSTLQVNSSLGEPLFAAVKISGTQQELNELVVALAPLETHKLFGLDRPLLPDDVQIAIERATPTERRLVVTTQLPMTEPLLSFVVRYQQGQNTGIRAFNALVNPRNPQALGLRTSGRRSVFAANTPSAALSRAPAPSATSSVAGRAPKALTALQADGQYGPVRSGDSTWRIARSIPPQAGQSIHQLIRQIVALNPGAFVNGDAARLRVGVTLNLPGAGPMLATGDGTQVARRTESPIPTAAPTAAVAAQPAAPVAATLQVAAGSTTTVAKPNLVLPRPRARPGWITGVRNKADLEKFVSLIQRLKEARVEQAQLRKEKEILEARAIAMGQRMVRMQSYVESQDKRITKLRQSLLTVNELLVKTTALTVQMNNLKLASNQTEAAGAIASLASSLTAKVKSSKAKQMTSATGLKNSTIAAAEKEQNDALAAADQSLSTAPSAASVTTAQASAETDSGAVTAATTAASKDAFSSQSGASSAAVAVAKTTAAGSPSELISAASQMASPQALTDRGAEASATVAEASVPAHSGSAVKASPAASASADISAGGVAVRNAAAPVVERAPVPERSTVRAPEFNRAGDSLLDQWLANEHVAALMRLIPPAADLPFVQTARKYGMSTGAALGMSSLGMFLIAVLVISFLWMMFVGRKRLTARDIAATKVKREADAKRKMAVKAATNQDTFRLNEPPRFANTQSSSAPVFSAEQYPVSVRDLSSESAPPEILDLLTEVEVRLAFGEFAVARRMVNKGLAMAPGSPELLAAHQRIDGLAQGDGEDWTAASDESLVTWGNPSKYDETVVPFERRDSSR